MIEVRDCKSCRWFETTEGYCIELEIFRHGYDGYDCPFFQKARTKKEMHVWRLENLPGDEIGGPDGQKEKPRV